MYSGIGDAMMVFADLAFMLFFAMVAVVVAIFIVSSPWAIIACMVGGGFAGLLVRRLVLPE